MYNGLTKSANKKQMFQQLNPIIATDSWVLRNSYAVLSSPLNLLPLANIKYSSFQAANQTDGFDGNALYSACLYMRPF